MPDNHPLDANFARHIGRSAPATRDEMLARVARFDRLQASDLSFIDSLIPGHERDLLSVIGAGVTEDAGLKPAISAADNFHIDYIRAEPGCGAALHAHDSEEVFVVISGRWEFYWGDEGGESVELAERDVISVPAHVMRGFRNLGDTTHLLLSVLGGRHPGPVVWSAKVLEQARATPLRFDAGGNAVRIDRT